MVLDTNAAQLQLLGRLPLDKAQAAGSDWRSGLAEAEQLWGLLYASS